MDIEEANRPRHEAACGLLEDWLVDEIKLRVTSEIFNDLDRQEESVRTRMNLAIRARWDQIYAEAEEVQRNHLEIRNILGEPSDASAASDQRHLAIASAAQAAAFATYDQKLLNNTPEILSRMGLRVQRPSEFIIEVDSVVRASHYQYRELKNTGIERLRVKSVDEVEIDQFIKSSRSEAAKSFASFIDGVLSRPERMALHQIRDSQGRSMAILAIQSVGEFIHIIQRMRIAHRLCGTRRGHTLIDYVAHQPLGAWCSGQPRIIRIDES